MMNAKPYRIIDLDQGSDEWHAWRRQGIGASEAPTLMGENPWSSPDRWFESRSGAVKRQAPSKSMALGTSLEPEARRAYEIFIGEAMSPLCVERIDIPWLHASLDGMGWDEARAVEIKCGARVYRETAMFRRVPKHYRAQLQHIMAVTGLPEMDFWAYWPNQRPVHLHVVRDERYIERLVETEQAAWERLSGLRVGFDGYLHSEVG